jgi:hypothetical protein
MSVKTVRFNKREEILLKKVLLYYDKDFSSCVKDLFKEKIEDLRDIAYIDKLREGKITSYVKADDIDKIYRSRRRLLKRTSGTLKDKEDSVRSVKKLRDEWES